MDPDGWASASGVGIRFVVGIRSRVSIWIRLGHRVGIIESASFGRDSSGLSWECMTRRRRSSSLHLFDPEMDKTLNRIRKTKNINVGHSSNSFNSIFEANTLKNKPDIDIEGAGDTEYVVPTVVHPISIAGSYELKFELIHLLPKFHGLVGEDSYKHLNEFHMGILEDYIKMKAFLFSLDGVGLAPVMFKTWGDMKRMFLEKFFSAFRTVTIRKEICGIRQHSRETLHEYWERFNKLCATFPHHQISKQLLLQYLYEGLLMMDRNMVDGANEGTLMDKILAAARHLISNMAIDRANIPCEVARCRVALTKYTVSVWNLHLSGAPCRYVSHFARNRVRKHIMHWSNRRWIPIRKATVSKLTVAIPTESKSRAIYNPEIWTIREHAKHQHSTNKQQMPP
ncbi:hypothetical protein CR513_50828, partial [Mucuna pruriens]